MSRLNQYVAAALLISMGLPLASLASETTLTCESKNNRHTYCPASITGTVTLARNSSSVTCSLDKNWGYDKEGIWVDKGCRGVFLIVNDDKMSKGNVTALAVGGGVLGLAALGILAASRKKKETPVTPSSDVTTNTTLPASGYTQTDYPTASSLPPLANVPPSLPGWAVGNFRGFDAQSNEWVDLSIDANGQAEAVTPKRQLKGYWQNYWLTLDSLLYQVLYDNQGLRLVSQQGQSVLYTRKN